MKNNLKPLYIVGAGGFGREVIWMTKTINEKSPEWNIKGFVDANDTLWSKTIDNYLVHGDLDLLEQMYAEVWCVVAVGNAKVRKRLIKRLSRCPHIRFATLISPDARIGLNSFIDEGSTVCAGTIITVDAHIGKHNILNLDCTVGHDAVLEDYVTLYPSVNVSGCVNIGTATEIGTGAQIIQGISIGSGAIIGTGAVVIRNIEDEVTAVGNPAKVIKKHVSDLFGGVYNRRIKSKRYFDDAKTYIRVA